MVSGVLILFRLLLAVSMVWFWALLSIGFGFHRKPLGSSSSVFRWRAAARRSSGARSDAVNRADEMPTLLYAASNGVACNTGCSMTFWLRAQIARTEIS